MFPELFPNSNEDFVINTSSPTIDRPLEAAPTKETFSVDVEDNDANRVAPAIDRRHDLDALRAGAMLLGIVLHAALSFSTIPWTVKDSHQSEIYDVIFSAIHGFRMPLFFMLSGFFTAMLWRKRGLGGLIKQRLKRIALPLLLGLFTVIPAMWAAIMFVNRPSETPAADAMVWEAIVAGETNRVRDAIQTSEIAVDAVSNDGATMLTVAVFLGHTEMVEMLIDQGVDVRQRNGDQGTALHSAAFVGRAEAAKLLLQAGADVDALDANGQTPKDLLKLDFGTTSFIAASFGLQLDEEALKAARAEIAEQMEVTEYLGSPSGSGQTAWESLHGLLFQLPIFMHLWFLWFLCWLIVAFVLYALVADRLRITRLPAWFVCSPLSLLWLVPLTMLPQSLMDPSTFGPDPSVGMLPIPSVLAYYGIFFFFGSLYWEMNDTDGKLGRHWPTMLGVAMLVVLPIGLDLVSDTVNFVSLPASASVAGVVSNFLQALYAWLMTFGLIGLCRRTLSKESKSMRYLSDSSYWLYLAHLPLILVAQWYVKDSPLPTPLKFVGITIAVSGFLLLTYRYGVRYTLIGRMLNGPRSRDGVVA